MERHGVAMDESIEISKGKDGAGMKRQHTQSTASALLRSHALILLVTLSSSHLTACTAAATTTTTTTTTTATGSATAASPSFFSPPPSAEFEGRMGHLLRIRGGGGAADTAEIGRVCGSDDYYEILGVERTCSAEDIKKAYRRLALILHPDKNTGDRINAEAAFKKLSEAYEVLGDQAKRSEFDRWGMAGPQQAASPPGGFGFDDQDFGYDQDVGQNPGDFSSRFGHRDPFEIFEEFFGVGGGGSGGGFGTDGFERGGFGGMFASAMGDMMGGAFGGGSGEFTQTVFVNGRRMTRTVRTYSDGSQEEFVNGGGEGRRTGRRLGSRNGFSPHQFAGSSFGWGGSPSGGWDEYSQRQSEFGGLDEDDVAMQRAIEESMKA